MQRVWTLIFQTWKSAIDPLAFNSVGSTLDDVMEKKSFGRQERIDSEREYKGAHGDQMWLSINSTLP